MEKRNDTHIQVLQPEIKEMPEKWKIPAGSGRTLLDSRANTQ